MDAKRQRNGDPYSAGMPGACRSGRPEPAALLRASGHVLDRDRGGAIQPAAAEPGATLEPRVGWFWAGLWLGNFGPPQTTSCVRTKILLRLFYLLPWRCHGHCHSVVTACHVFCHVGPSMMFEKVSGRAVPVPPYPHIQTLNLRPPHDRPSGHP